MRSNSFPLGRPYRRVTPPCAGRFGSSLTCECGVLPCWTTTGKRVDVKNLDITTALVIAVPTGFVTSLTMNFLEDQYSWPVAFAIGALPGYSVAWWP